jgi:hypothetical protein
MSNMNNSFQLKEPCMCGDPECRHCYPFSRHAEPEPPTLTECMEFLGSWIDDAADSRDAGDALALKAWKVICEARNR